MKEAKILEVMHHPNIVRFREVYKTKKGKLCIVMDYCEGGNILDLIKKKHKERKKNANGQPSLWSENHVLNWFTQILLGIKHVHDRKILHRDIKSENIFLTASGMVKLGDFGISTVLNRTESKAESVVGAPYYLPPEIIQNKPYNFKADIWSLGCVLYELCALKPPFNGSTLHSLANRIINGKY